MKKFIITGTQRTGSSALAEYISFNKSICCGWEWTQFTPWHRKINIAHEALNGNFNALKKKHRIHILSQNIAEAKWIGFRRLFRSSDKWIVHPRFAPALIVDRLADHIDWIKKNPDIHIIQIVRRDKIEWLKSMYISKKLKSYVGKQYPTGTKIDIPVMRAIRRLKTKQYIDSELYELRKHNPHLLVEYEKFLEFPIETINDVMDFLRCSRMEIDTTKSKVKKQSTMSAHNYIKNYDSLAMKINKIFNASHLEN